MLVKLSSQIWIAKYKIQILEIRALKIKIDIFAIRIRILKSENPIPEIQILNSEFQIHVDLKPIKFKSLKSMCMSNLKT